MVLLLLFLVVSVGWVITKPVFLQWGILLSDYKLHAAAENVQKLAMYQ